MSTSFTVPEGVKYIAEGAMGGNTYVQNVSLPATVGSIGSSAFKDCMNLRTINIPCSNIGENAFENCSKLTSIDLSNVGYLGGRSFQNCTSLKTIILGSAFSYEEYGDIKYMDHIGENVFILCNSISDIYVINKNLTCYGFVSVGEDYDQFVNVNMFYNNFDATVHVPSGCLSSYQSAGQWKSFTSWVEDKSVDVKCAIDDATKTWNAATEGDAEGQYKSGAKAELKNVIDEVLEAWSLGLADNVCDNLLQQISNALATFESKKVTEISTKQEQTLALIEIPTLTYGDDTYILPQTTAEELALSWSTDDDTVATISGNKLTIVGAGTTTVTATQAGNNVYKSFSRKFTLTAKKAMLTITANDCTKQEGDLNPELTVSYSGFKYNDNVASLTIQPIVTTTAMKDSPVGTYPITVSGAASRNYEFTYVNGTMTVTEKTNTIEVTDISQMANAIYIEPFAARAGDDVQIEINLKNANTASAYVFDLVLPEGITVDKDSHGKYVDALSDRHNDHTRAFNDKGNNTYSMSALSGNSEELTGNDGVIRLLTLHVDDNLAEGVYPIEIKNASYSLPNGALVDLESTISTITVEDYLLGDVNGNNKIDIGDAVSIVNYLVGKESSTFVSKAADTNKNGKIDIGDAVTIVNFLVGKTQALSPRLNMDWDEHEPQ